MGTKMKIGALDRHVVGFVTVVIVVGAILLAIPVFIFGLIQALWSALRDAFISWAGPRKPGVAKRITQWAEASEAWIVGQSGKQTKID
jgi:NhaP-type Na+/H+ or K+/H+ antiporter